MKRSTPKHPDHKKPSLGQHCQPGFASVLAVISVSVALLLILVSIYNDTIESQFAQKDNMLRSDYQQREEAFLRALTNIIPNKAVIAMQDNSANPNNITDLQWNTIFNQALTLSNASNQQITEGRANAILNFNSPDDPNDPGLEAANFNELRFGNSAESNIQRSSVILPSSLYGNANPPASDQVFSASNKTASINHPAPLNATTQAIADADSTFPLVSFDKQYGNLANQWVNANVVDHPLYNLVDSPSLHFNYKTGGTMIAKHNWWAFGLSMAANDANVTGLTSRTKDYLVSLYEIPSQLGINSSSFTSLGAHAGVVAADGTVGPEVAWTNINVQGSAYAKRVLATDNFSSDAISSREGVAITGNSVDIGGQTAAGDPFASNLREESQSAGATFPITSAANGGRVSFLSINRGLAFYDRFATVDPATGDLPTGNLTAGVPIATPIGDSSGNNSVSTTSWDYYSIGANQCSMRLDIIDIADPDATDDPNLQKPSSIRFTYFSDSTNPTPVTQVFTQGQGNNWPTQAEANGITFPFHVQQAATGRWCIVLYADRLQEYLSNNGGAGPDINNSISINPEYTPLNTIPNTVSGNRILRPSFPAVATDMGLILAGTRDLTSFIDPASGRGGFSLVTNLRLILEDDINEVTAPTPQELVGILPTNTPYTPALSFFAPETRYGNNTNTVEIEVNGQLTSLAEDGNGPTRIGDLKSGANDAVNPANISANLRSLDHPSQLPPINTFNWMVVVREIHP